MERKADHRTENDNPSPRLSQCLEHAPEVIHPAEQDLRHLMQQRAQIIKRIATVRKTIAGLCGLIHERELPAETARSVCTGLPGAPFQVPTSTKIPANREGAAEAHHGRFGQRGRKHCSPEPLYVSWSSFAQLIFHGWHHHLRLSDCIRAILQHSRWLRLANTSQSDRSVVMSVGLFATSRIWDIGTGMRDREERAWWPQIPHR
jgi:hypothetical protein